MTERGTLATYLGCCHICSHPTLLIGALLPSFVPNCAHWNGPTIARACQHMPEPTRVHPPWLLCPLLSMLLVAGMHILVVVNITDSDLLTFVLTIFNLHCEVVSELLVYNVYDNDLHCEDVMQVKPQGWPKMNVGIWVMPFLAIRDENEYRNLPHAQS
jgi:hypothetical protein